MSEFNVVVVELGKIGKHPDADTLSITTIHGGYPCIIKSGTFEPGQKVAYIPVDALVPAENPHFEFLGKSQSVKTLNGKNYFRIKACKLRGIFSMGLLVPAEESWVLGQNVQFELGIEKYDPPSRIHGGQSAKDPGILPKYTDVDGLRKYKNVFYHDEEIVLTEKVHGENFRVIHDGEKLHVGSHHQFKKEEAESKWWKNALQYGLDAKLKDFPMMGIYGEAYGHVQDLRYGMRDNEIKLIVFDVFDVKAGVYLDYDAMKEFATNLGLDVVPELYRGVWSDELLQLAEGKTFIAGADHIREGFVARPVHERWDKYIGRVIVKMHGQGFLLRKQKD